MKTSAAFFQQRDPNPHRYDGQWHKRQRRTPAQVWRERQERAQAIAEEMRAKLRERRAP